MPRVHARRTLATIGDHNSHVNLGSDQDLPGKTIINGVTCANYMQALISSCKIESLYLEILYDYFKYLTQLKIAQSDSSRD